MHVGNNVVNYFEFELLLIFGRGVVDVTVVVTVTRRGCELELELVLEVGVEG